MGSKSPKIIRTRDLIRGILNRNERGVDGDKVQALDFAHLIHFSNKFMSLLILKLEMQRMKMTDYLSSNQQMLIPIIYSLKVIPQTHAKKMY